MLPEVGSITTLSGVSEPSFSAASIIAAPILSLTLAKGLKTLISKIFVRRDPWLSFVIQPGRFSN